MNKKELLDILKKNTFFAQEAYLQKKEPLLYSQIEKKGRTWKESLYLFLYDLDIPQCQNPHCSQPTSFYNTLVDPNIKEGYGRYCSKKCANTGIPYIDTSKGFPESLFKNGKRVSRYWTQEVIQHYFPKEFNELSNSSLSFEEALYRRVYNAEKNKCKICDNSTRFENFSKGYSIYCSPKCMANDPEIKKKIREKIKLLDNDEIKEKRRNTNKERYGVEHPSQLPELKDRIKENLEKARENITTYSLQDKEVHQKTIESRKKNEYERKKEKYNVLTFEEEYNQDKERYNFTCKDCNKSFTSKLRPTQKRELACPQCNPVRTFSKEKEIGTYIESLGIIPRYNDKTTIKPLELDLFIEDRNLAIEFDGLFFHSFGKDTKNSSSSFNTFILDNYKEEGNYKGYHMRKTQLCESKNIHLLHIFENEWVDPIKKDIWMSIISWKLQQNTRLFARNLILDTEVSPNETKLFLEENHLQGYVPSSIRIGLRNKEWELISLMTFWKSRYWKEYTYELLRFVTLRYTVVVGGASKLIKYFKSIMKEGEILVTYADRRYSQGNVYEKLGMTSIGETKPNYFYFKPGSFELFSRVSYQKHKLEEKLEHFNPELTETENMYNHGYRKIYDCGNKKYIYKK